MAIKIYTDGSSKGNPGRGGYGIVMRYGHHEKEFCQGFRLTTNNRMELLAVIVALENLKTTKYPVEIYSDSKYVIDAITKGWLAGWVKKDFKGKKNPDLWKRYIKAAAPYKINFHWVKGHNGHPENERCDTLAFNVADGDNLIVDEYFENVQSKEA